LLQLLSKVTVTSRGFHIECAVSALLLDDALKPATPLTNGAINQTLRQFAAFRAPELSWIVNINKPSI